MERTALAIMMLVGLCSPIRAGDTAADFGLVVRQFSAARHMQALELSSHLNLPMPDKAESTRSNGTEPVQRAKP